MKVDEEVRLVDRGVIIATPKTTFCPENFISRGVAANLISCVFAVITKNYKVFSIKKLCFGVSS